MRYKIYTRTEQAWDAMLSAIRRAKQSIFFEMYIFKDDTADSHDFIEILSQKSLSGVKVKVIFDSFGSEITESSVKKLKSAGVEIFFFKKFFRVNHRKILIIDENVAFVGGVNVKKIFRKWDDILVELRGRVVKHILKSFARMYGNSGGKDEFVLKYGRNLIFAKGKVWFYEHFPPKDSFRLNKYYRDKIESAEKSISIVTPYLMPNHWLLKALVRAIERGVKVEVIMPRVAMHPKIANVPNYFYMHKLHKRGVRFFLTNEMNHSKMMVVDGKEGIIGSQNLDILSFDFDMESGVFFKDAGLLNELSLVIEKWKTESVPYHPKMRSLNFLDSFYEFCFGVFEQAVKFLNKFTA